MTPPIPPRRPLRQQLAELAAAYQADAVIPHCTRCRRPCCKLDALVLELEWRQVKALWQIEETRSAFDRRLAAGRGPVELRPANGLYYAHTRPCPAYDQGAGTCRVYGQDVKPVGCSDFPVYEDGGDVIADLRCEAVDLKALETRLAAALAPGQRLVRHADPDFPFLVTLSVEHGAPRRRRKP